MNKPSMFELASVVAGMASIGASLSLNDVGVIVGIATALLTCLSRIVYTWRRDRREQRESDARLSDTAKHR